MHWGYSGCLRTRGFESLPDRHKFSMDQTIQNFIDGQFVEPIDGKYLDNIEPATGKPYSKVADSDARDVDLAVAAAEKAFTDWSRMPATERSKILLRVADLIERDLEKFARAESIDTGKPLAEIAFGQAAMHLVKGDEIDA